mmetsp:Transcript_34278/g.97963  ORF Transcript_34278/g.97963 Transcript_34278/m.97963 type:complete len:320 (+) Transcript_34278:749-1708(+)
MGRRPGALPEGSHLHPRQHCWHFVHCFPGLWPRLGGIQGLERDRPSLKCPVDGQATLLHPEAGYGVEACDRCRHGFWHQIRGAQYQGIRKVIFCLYHLYDPAEPLEDDHEFQVHLLALHGLLDRQHLPRSSRLRGNVWLGLRPVLHLVGKPGGEGAISCTESLPGFKDRHARGARDGLVCDADGDHRLRLRLHIPVESPMVHGRGGLHLGIPAAPCPLHGDMDAVQGQLEVQLPADERRRRRGPWYRGCRGRWPGHWRLGVRADGAQAPRGGGGAPLQQTRLQVAGGGGGGGRGSTQAQFQVAGGGGSLQTKFQVAGRG